MEPRRTTYFSYTPKLDQLWRNHSNNVPSKQQLNAQENVLILFRTSVFPFIARKSTSSSNSCIGKLREGISSSGRADSFALESLSVAYASIYDINTYITSSLRNVIISDSLIRFTSPSSCDIFPSHINLISHSPFPASLSPPIDSDLDAILYCFSIPLSESIL